MKLQKQGVGIDISKSTFTVCLCTRLDDDTLNYSDVSDFSNDTKGFNQLLRWTRKKTESTLPVYFLMEATGVYYEKLAYHLDSIKQKVNVVLPNTSKHYFSSLNIKTKTDAIDAKVLSRFSVERNHKIWQRPSDIFLKLRNLTRYCLQLKEQKTSLGNVKHSKDHSHDVQKLIIRSNKKLIKEIDNQIELIKKEITKLIKSDPELQDRVSKLETIKGVGFSTIVTILAETLGFQYVQNVKQLVSYAGYDVVKRESGTSIKGKTRISKKGNKYIRNALYFPAMVACRYNEEMKQNYLRIITNKTSKMIGQVAIQRKLLILIYSLWSKNEIYNSNYKKVTSSKMLEVTQDS